MARAANREFWAGQGPPPAWQHLSCPQLVLGPQPHAGTVSHGDLLWQQVWIVKEACRDPLAGEGALGKLFPFIGLSQASPPAASSEQPEPCCT